MLCLLQTKRIALLLTALLLGGHAVEALTTKVKVS
jgi:hypothetical protein